MQNTKKISVIAMFVIFGIVLSYAGFLLYWQKNFIPLADVSESPPPEETPTPEISPTPEETPTPTPTPEETPTPTPAPTPTPNSQPGRPKTPTPTPTPVPTPEPQPTQGQTQSEANTNTNEQEVTIYEEPDRGLTVSTPTPSPVATLQTVKSPSITSNRLSKLDLPISPENTSENETVIAGFALLPQSIYFIYIIIPVIITVAIFFYLKKRKK